MLMNMLMGLRLFRRAWVLAIYIVTMVPMGYNLMNRLPTEIGPASFMLLVTTIPIWVVASFAREFLAQPPSFLLPGLRKSLLRTLLLLCLGACLASMLAMVAFTPVSMATALTVGVCGLATSALIGLLALKYPRLSFLVWGQLVIWPLYKLRVDSLSWSGDYTWIAVMVGLVCLGFLIRSMRTRDFHRSLCTQPVMHLADWYDPARKERKKLQRERIRSFQARSNGSALLDWIHGHARIAARRGQAARTRAWLHTWAVVAEFLPSRRRFLVSAGILILLLLTFPYLDSFFMSDTETSLRWFSGWLVTPALFAAVGTGYLGRRSALLTSRHVREQTGLYVGMVTVLMAGTLGLAVWMIGQGLAQVMPALPISSTIWSYHAPAAYVALLPLAIVPVQLLAVVVRRRPSSIWPYSVGFQVFLILHILMQTAPGAWIGLIVGGFAAASAAIYVVLWRRRCRQGDILE